MGDVIVSFFGSVFVSSRTSSTLPDDVVPFSGSFTACGTTCSDKDDSGSSLFDSIVGSTTTWSARDGDRSSLDTVLESGSSSSSLASVFCSTVSCSDVEVGVTSLFSSASVSG